jgi:uncharacterized metal-binding protein
VNCPACDSKGCRALQPCSFPSPGKETLIDAYQEPSVQAIVQAAAGLVDGGLAGQLSRVEELERFILAQNYRKVGLAYCYGMEKEATAILARFKGQGIKAVAVSCTVGGMPQNTVNQASALPGVSCNPLTQAAQLTAEGVDLAVTVGLCLGHDILFTRAFAGDQTTLVVKDRVHRHQPLAALAEQAILPG